MNKEKRGLERPWGPTNSERRRHPRFSVDLPVEYWLVDKSKTRPGQAIDISEGGLLLRLSEPLEIGQVVGLTLFIPLGPNLDAIEALAQVQVVWQDGQAGKDNAYRAGVKFVDISPADMDKWKNLINTLKGS
jgi:c-di-GMP-binding flagellar brake protein YcgR